MFLLPILAFAATPPGPKRDAKAASDLRHNGDLSC